MRGRGKLLSKCPTVKRVLRCEGENDISFPVNIQSREYSLFSNGEPCFSDAANWTATSHSGREICDGNLSLEKKKVSRVNRVFFFEGLFSTRTLLMVSKHGN